MKIIAEERPVVYSCSGCSSSAQMANYIAVKLDRKRVAEMSCIAGVGGNVKNFLHPALLGRKIITIDGCPLACAKACLNNHNKTPDFDFELTAFGVSKKSHEDFDIKEADEILEQIQALINGGINNFSSGSFKKPDSILFDNPVSSLTQPSLSYVTIKEVLDKKQLKAFIDFPYKLYKGNRYYVPQLKKDIEDTFDKRKNPAFEFCEARYWLAYKENKVVGRIAGIINHAYIEKWGNKFIRFGWMDFENDKEIVKCLLEQVENWAKEKGFIAVHGPLGFTNFDNAGMLIEGFDQLGTFATSYNFPYYPLLMNEAGYSKDVDWVEYKIKLPKVEPGKLERIATVVQRRLDLKIIKISSTRDILRYSKDIFNLLNSSYSELYGIVPLTEKQIQYYTKKYLTYIRPDFVSLVSDKMGQLVAFGITMPSMSYALQKAKGNLFPFGYIYVLKALRKNKLADLYLIAVRKDFQGKGVNGLVMHELTRLFVMNGIKYAESNPELEQNRKVQSIWEYYQAIQHKRRRSYIKYL